MSEGADPPKRTVPAPEEMPWSISYLRDDIQELRGQVGSLHSRLDESHRSLHSRLDESHRSLQNRIDEIHRSLSGRIDETNKRMDTQFLWTLGTLVTLTGVLIAVIKL